MLLISYRHTWYGYSWLIYWLIESNEPCWELKEVGLMWENYFSLFWNFEVGKNYLEFLNKQSIFCLNEGFCLGWNRWTDFGDWSPDSHWSSSNCSSLNIPIYDGHLWSFQCSGFIMSEQIRQVFSTFVHKINVKINAFDQNVKICSQVEIGNGT